MALPVCGCCFDGLAYLPTHASIYLFRPCSYSSTSLYYTIGIKPTISYSLLNLPRPPLHHPNRKGFAPSIPPSLHGSPPPQSPCFLPLSPRHLSRRLSHSRILDTGCLGLMITTGASSGTAVVIGRCLARLFDERLGRSDTFICSVLSREASLTHEFQGAEEGRQRGPWRIEAVASASPLLATRAPPQQTSLGPSLNW